MKVLKEVLPTVAPGWASNRWYRLKRGSTIATLGPRADGTADGLPPQWEWGLGCALDKLVTK